MGGGLDLVFNVSYGSPGTEHRYAAYYVHTGGSLVYNAWSAEDSYGLFCSPDTDYDGIAWLVRYSGVVVNDSIDNVDYYSYGK